MAAELVLTVDGPFSLAAAAAFGFGPNAGRPAPGEDMMRLAFAADDLVSQAGAVIRQHADGSLAVELHGDAPQDVAISQVRRILSVDTEVSGWLAAGKADPVLGERQAEHPGLRPVLFHSPYEAAAWSVLSQRRHRTQATALRRRLAEAAGVVFELAGQPEAAFPLPERLLGVAEFPGIEPVRMVRLHGVARAALDGQLEAAAIRSMPQDEAMTSLQRINGLGSFYAMLVYLRSAGVRDGLSIGEPRLAGYLRHYYGLPAAPDSVAIQRLAEPWRPFRTWASVLFRVAGDRAGLPFDRPQASGMGRRADRVHEGRR